MTAPGRHRKVAAPTATIAVAAGIAAVTFAPIHHGYAAVADSHSLYGGPAKALAPFNATPKVFSIDQPVVTRNGKKQQPPAASAPITHLPTNLDVTATEIPRVVLAAFVNAAHLANESYATCHITWQTIAGIGLIESDDARSGGSFTRGWDGEASPPIYGPMLNGTDGFPSIRDRSAGKLDGNSPYVRAIGPMQFLPSTWQEYAADGNGDGVKDPQQIDDATLATADYLCNDGGDLSKLHNLHKAIYAYNHSWKYVKDVLTVVARYMGANPKSLGVRIGNLDLPKHKTHRIKPAGPGKAPVFPSTSSTPTVSSPGTTTSSPTPSGSGTGSPSPSTSVSGSGSPSPSQSASPSQSPSPPGGVASFG